MDADLKGVLLLLRDRFIHPLQLAGLIVRTLQSHRL